MRALTLTIVASLFTLTGCDLLKHGSSADGGATTANSTTTTSGGNANGNNGGSTAPTGVATADNAKNDPANGATSACAWPQDNGLEKNFTITKGCNITAKHNLDIREGATLTIEQGVKIAFDTDTYVWVRYGKLVIQGTADAPVTFTSSNTSPAPGDWVGIGFEDKTGSGTTIDHLIMEYTGSKSSGGHGAVELEDMRTGGRISITNSTFKNGAQFGIVAGDNATFAKFENNTFKDLKSGAMNVKAEVLGSVGHGNAWNGLAIHVKPSDVDQTTTWPAVDVPIFVDGDINIHSDSSVPALTIADKSIVKMTSNAMINVGESNPGALVAKNVTFTSSSPSPSEGDWSGVFLHPKSSGSTIDNCIFEYFGSGSHGAHGAITLEDVNAKDLHGITVTNNTFRKGKWQGIYTDDGDCKTMSSNKGDGIPACGKNR